MSEAAIQPLFLRNLRAMVPGGAVPVTEFKSGKEIQLRWESNGSLFELYAADQAQPIYRGFKPECTIPAGLTRTTTLILVASSGVAGEGSAAGFEAVKLYATITLTVSDPTLTPKSVTTDTLDVAGEASVTGSLEVTGKAEISRASIGDLSILRSAEMLKPKTFSEGSHTSSTDALVLATITPPSNASKKSYVVVEAVSKVTKAFATGGIYGVTDSATAQNPNSLLLPVKAGESFTVKCVTKEDSDNPVTLQYWWFPFGIGAELTPLSDEEAEALGIAATPLPPPVDFVPDPEPMIVELIELLEEVAAEPLDEEAKRRFARTVRELAVPPVL